ncbi:hypothetical protein GF373_06465, partial [bacterium]|nr:hypothetical protein [bacterium]
MKNYRIHSLCVGLFVVVSAMAAAQEPPIEPTKILAEPYQVSMFKNGIGLLHLTAELPDNSGGTYLIHPVPKATLGSFWVAVPKGCKLRDVKITKTRTQETVHAASLAEMLEANIGKTVYLKIDDIWQELTIKEIPEQHEKPVIQPRNDNIIPPPPPPKQGTLVIVDDDGYERAIPLDVIKEMRIKEGKLNREIELPKDEEAIQLTVDFSHSQASEKPVVSLISLSRGVAWSPSYVVDISEEKEASFTAKCVVVNDLIPIKDTK